MPETRPQDKHVCGLAVTCPLVNGAYASNLIDDDLVLLSDFELWHYVLN